MSQSSILCTIKPLFQDHLQYKTTFAWSQWWSQNTGPTVCTFKGFQYTPRESTWKFFFKSASIIIGKSPYSNLVLDPEVDFLQMIVLEDFDGHRVLFVMVERLLLQWTQNDV